MRSVTVLIPCYNGEPTLPAVLEALDRQDVAGLPFEALTIDDGSKDRTVEIAQAFARTHPWLRVLENHENVGLAATLERGRREAKGGVLITLHEDIVPRQRDWVRRLVDELDASGAAVVLSRVHQHVEALQFVDRFFLEGPARQALGLKAEAYDRAKLSAVGGFECGLRNAGEDIDLAGRLKKAGHAFHAPGGVDVDHVMSRRQRGLRNHLRKEIQLSRVHPRLWRRYRYSTTATHAATILLVLLMAALLPIEAKVPSLVWSLAPVLPLLALAFDFRQRWRFSSLTLLLYGTFGLLGAAVLRLDSLMHPATLILIGVGTTVLCWNLLRGLLKARRLRDPRMFLAALPLFLLQDAAKGWGFLLGLPGLLTAR